MTTPVLTEDGKRLAEVAKPRDYWAIVGLTPTDEHGHNSARVIDRSPDCKNYDVCVETLTEDDGDDLGWAKGKPAGLYRITMRPYGDEDSYSLNVTKAEMLFPLNAAAARLRPVNGEMADDNEKLQTICDEVEREFQCGGLSGGLYGDFAQEVARRYTTAASLRLPIEGDASLREAAQMFADHYPHGLNPRLDEAYNLARAALARPQPEAKGPVAAGVERQNRELTQDESRLVMSALLSSAPEVVAEMSADWKCPKCRCRTFAAVDERKPDGSFGPGDLLRCVNCKGVFFRASLAPPAEAKTPDAGVGLREAAQALLDASIADYGLSDDDTDPEPVAMGFRGGTAVTFGHLRRLKAALTPTGSAGEDDTGVTHAMVTAGVEALNAAADHGRTQAVADIYRAMRSLAQPPKAETPAGVGEAADKLSNAALELAEYASYAETIGAISHNRSTIRTWCDAVFKASREYEAIAALSTAPAARPGDGVERVRHVKRGTEYEVLGEAEAQVSKGTHSVWPKGIAFHVDAESVPGRLLSDGWEITVYRCVTTGKLWCRFTDEFRDGRFVPAAAPAADGGRA